MKDLELELISELMKNSRRSDRELAKVLKVSQPTVSRTMDRIKKRGLIREFTIIPDFQKLGYQLVAFILIRTKSGLTTEELEEARKTSLKDMREKSPPEIVLFERGLGGGYTSIIVSFHHNYTEYSRLKERMKEYPFLDHGATMSFLMDLNDNIHYRYFTFSTLAKHLLGLEDK
jgi:DNA-binding Lrp family transcriptional regulator